MAKLLKEIIPDKPQYKDRRFPGSQDAWEKCLRESSTVYVGNLSFCTREEQVYEVFSKVGSIERVIMGLHKEQRTPCGFCFVKYHTRTGAQNAVSYINRTKLDNRCIRVDVDWGFVEGRQYGRGKSGGQVRDEYRMEYDPGRGGLGVQAQYEQGMKHDQGPMRGRKRGRDYSLENGHPPRGPMPPPLPPPPPPPPPPHERVDVQMQENGDTPAADGGNDAAGVHDDGEMPADGEASGRPGEDTRPSKRARTGAQDNADDADEPGTENVAVPRQNGSKTTHNNETRTIKRGRSSMDDSATEAPNAAGRSIDGDAAASDEENRATKRSRAEDVDMCTDRSEREDGGANDQENGRIEPVSHRIDVDEDDGQMEDGG